MKPAMITDESKRGATESSWLWTNGRVALLSIWAFLLGANIVRLAEALNSGQPWIGAALGVAVAAGGIVVVVGTARRRHG